MKNLIFKEETVFLSILTVVILVVSIQSGTLLASGRNVKEEKISGVVFYDQNKNRIKDKFEYGIPGVTVLLDTKDDVLPIITQSNGAFEYSLTRYTYNRMKGQGELKVRPETLPLGGYALENTIPITKVGEHNIPIYYESQIYDLFAKGSAARKLKYKVDIFDGTRKTRFRGDLKNQKLIVGRKKVTVPRALITVPDTVDLSKEPISATFKFKNQKKKIRARSLLVVNSRGKIVKKRTFKQKVPKYEMKAKLKQGKYYLQGKFIFADGSVMYSNLNKFYIIKKEKLIYTLKPKVGNYSFPFDVELGSFQFMINEGKNARSLIIINYAKDKTEKKEEESIIVGEDDQVTAGESESKAEDNADKEVEGEDDEDVVEVEEVGSDFYARVLRKYMVSNGMKPDSIILKENDNYTGKHLKVMLYDLRKTEIEIKPYVRVNNKKLKVGEDLSFDDRVTPKIRFKLDVKFKDGGRVVMGVTNPLKKSPKELIDSESLDYNKYKNYWEKAKVTYTAALKNGYRLFYDGSEIPVDKNTRMFSIPLVIDEGENNIDFVLKPQSGKKDLTITRIFRVVTKGVYLNVITPKSLITNFDGSKPEFIRIVTKGKYKLILNGYERKLNDGTASILYDFDRGENVLDFTLTSFKKKYNKTLIINIDDIKGPPRMYFEAYGGYATTNISYKTSSSTVPYTGSMQSYGAKVGFVPFSFTGLRNNTYLRNLFVALDFGMGSGSVAYDGTSVNLKERRFGFEIYEFFNLYKTPTSDLKSSIRSIEIAPLIEYSSYSLSYSDALLGISLTNTANKIGLITRLNYNSSSLDLGLKYSLFGSSVTLDPEPSNSPSGSTVTNLSLKYNYALANMIVSFEGKYDSFNVSYPGGSSTSITSKGGMVTLRWQFD